MERLQREFLEYLRFNRNASAHTARAYAGDLRQLLDFARRRLGREPAPADLDHRLIRAFLADLYERGRARASSARTLAAIRSFCRYLRREGILDDNPAALVAAPRPEQRMPAHLDVADMDVLLAAPDAATPLGRRDRAILELLYASGLRLSELVGLDLDDVNLGGRVVRVRGKGGRERIVPFHQRAADAIRDYLPVRHRLCAPAGPEAAVRPAGRGRESVVRQLPRRPALGAQRGSAAAALRGPVEHPARHQPSRAAALVRDAPAGTRGGPAVDPGAAGPCAGRHDPALHARQRGPDHQPLPQDPPPRIAGGAPATHRAPGRGQDDARSAASLSSASHWFIRSPTSHMSFWWRSTASCARSAFW